MEFNKKQKEIIYATESKILCLAAAASGKALPNSEIIPTPNGPKKVGEIKEGDYLFDAEGKPTKVLGVFPQGEREVYELVFSDGRTARSSEDHIWYVHSRGWANKQEYREMTVKELLTHKLVDSGRGAKFSIPVAPAVEYGEKKYKIDPYIMGAFLGDGCCMKHSRLVLSSKDGSIPKIIANILGNTIIDDWYDNDYKYSFYNLETKKYYYTKEFFKEYETEVLRYSYDKSIPYEYKYGSIEQRLALVQGLMDTDGGVDGNNVRFTSTSLSLIKDLQEVLLSLGYVSKIHIDERPEIYISKGKCYFLLINIPNSEKYKLFRMKEKKQKALLLKDKKQKKYFNKTYIREIKKLDYKEEMTCFYVDNEKHLFLTKDFIITHNTRVLTERVRVLLEEKHIDPSKIVVISFTNLAAEEMRRRLGESANGMFIGTLHSYAGKICSLNGINVQPYLDKEQFDKVIARAILIPKNKYPKIKYLLIDECQDFNQDNYNFCSRCPAENIFYVGDDRQMIYGFRGASLDALKSIYNDPTYKKYYLTDNYRNTPEIIDFAEQFIWSRQALSGKSIPTKVCGEDVNECSFFSAVNDLIDDGNWKKWTVLCRTNAQVEAVVNYLQEKEIPCISFKKGGLDVEELNALLDSNRVKVLTVHTMKGSEEDNVIVVGCKGYNDEERRICYVAATRAKERLYWCPAFKNNGKMTKSKKDYFRKQVFEKVIEF